MLAGVAGQAAAGTQGYLGGRLGATSSKLTGDYADDLESVSRWSGGVVLMVAFTDWFALQPEFLVSQKGASGSIVLEPPIRGISGVSGTAKINYVEVPVQLKFTLANSTPIQPYVSAGGWFAAAVSSEASGEIDRGGSTEPIDENIDNATADSDYGFVVGAGIDVPYRTAILELDFRYTQGFAAVENSPVPLDLTHQTMWFTLGIFFHVGGKQSPYGH